MAVTQVQLLEPLEHQGKAMLVAVKVLLLVIKVVGAVALALLALPPLLVQVTTGALVEVEVRVLVQPSQAQEFFMLVAVVEALIMVLHVLV